MNPQDATQTRFALVREMLETPALIRGLDWANASRLVEPVRQKGGLFLAPRCFVWVGP